MNTSELELTQFENKIQAIHKADYILNYVIVFTTIAIAPVVMYKGLMAAQDEQWKLLVFGGFMLITGCYTLVVLGRKYKVELLETGLEKDKNIELIHFIRNHYAEKALPPAGDHVCLWIFGGIQKQSYIVNLFAAQHAVVINVKIQRGILDFGSVKKKRKEIEDLINGFVSKEGG
ncbi:hypothetical protein [Pedobacter sp. BAL39]|uniref:hypothetical protein n=1 Tax=Pedobacter sp. BAL39 TaxID=391596 RepID=UPI0002F84E03|nr:hypothetical protein [Pedobacter sp. BAL39]